MNWIAETLWDLIGRRQPGTGNRQPGGKNRQPGIGNRQPVEKKQQSNAHDNTPANVLHPPAADSRLPVAVPSKPSMQQRYDALVIEMKKTHNLRIRKWRSSTSGCAWQVTYENGQVARLIESPYPRGPMSCAIFLHEVGHHVIGLRTYRPRCLEEFKAWEWSLAEMRRQGLNVTPAVERRMANALHYAVSKARRRGLKRLPVELVPYLQRPVRQDDLIHK